jgi:hypothetical protein
MFDDPVGGTSLELVNEGGTAYDVACVAAIDGGIKEFLVGALASGSSSSVLLNGNAPRDFKCVATARDSRGRMHLWSYDGRHERLAKHRHLQPQATFERMYPDTSS